MERKIIDYEVTAGESRPEFISNLLEFVRDGWQPYGPMLFDREGWYTQPIVRYAEQSELEQLRQELDIQTILLQQLYNLSLKRDREAGGTVSDETHAIGVALHRARFLLKQTEGAS